MLEVGESGAGPGQGPVPAVPSVPQEEQSLRQRAHALCRDYLHGAWLHLHPTDMVFNKISGGLSNLLYYCGLPDGVSPVGSEPSRLLLRLYGQANEAGAMETLVTESVICALLSESQRGPRLYGVFPGGRLEEYIPARALVTRELCDPRLSRLIAEKMAQIHLMDVPINKRPKWLWKTMESWLKKINEVMNNGGFSAEQASMFRRIQDLNLYTEMAWLKEFLGGVSSPVVFCHNDIQEGNILLTGSAERPSIVIIDYEYCSYNYRGFDLANHFCEWAYDYSNQDPPYFWEDFTPITRQRQEYFAKCYLECGGARPGDTVESLLAEANAFILASHFFWALWSIVNSTVSKITFDYSGYGESRFKAYYRHKEEMNK